MLLRHRLRKLHPTKNQSTIIHEFKIQMRYLMITAMKSPEEVVPETVRRLQEIHDSATSAAITLKDVKDCPDEADTLPSGSFTSCNRCLLRFDECSIVISWQSIANFMKLVHFILLLCSSSWNAPALLSCSVTMCRLCIMPHNGRMCTATIICRFSIQRSYKQLDFGAESVAADDPQDRQMEMTA